MTLLNMQWGNDTPNLQSGETTLLNLRHGEMTLLNLQSREITLLNLRSGETTLLNLWSGETTLLNLWSGETTLLNLQIRETTLNLQSREMTHLNLQSGKMIQNLHILTTDVHCHKPACAKSILWVSIHPWFQTLKKAYFPKHCWCAHIRVLFTTAVSK